VPIANDPSRQEQVIEHRRVSERHQSTVAGGARINLNLTAMIDVTFLLLIYFLVATEFKLGEEVYRLDLPERMPSQLDRDPFELDVEPLRIEVMTTGIGPRAVTLRLDGPYPQPRSFDELARFLNQRRISEATPGGMFQPDHPVIVRPASATRWEHVIEAFNTVVKSGYTNVTFARPG
jgi:biopolymer transport protein ExbD